MKSIKNHISLVFALSTLLAAFQSFVSFSQLVGDYERDLGDEYAIVIASKQPLEISAIVRAVPQAVGLETIDSAIVLDEVKESLGAANMAYLRNALPHFYRLKLSGYPSIDERSAIESQLKKNDAILRVETFAKTQDRLYKMLLLTKSILLVLAALMFLTAFLLIVRQMQVWRFEHSKRISVMAIFGAPMWLRSAILYKTAFLDSIAATLIVGGLFYYLSADSTLQRLLGEIGLGGVRYDAIYSSLILLGVSLAISISSVSYAIFNAEEYE